MDALYDPAVDDQWQIRLGKWPNAWDNTQIAWSGAVCAEDRLYVFGGGHNDSPHNGLQSVDPKTGSWRRETSPSGQLWVEDVLCPNDVCLAPDGVECPVVYNGAGQPSPQCGEMPDGQPTSRHTYYLLATDGAGIYVAGGALFPQGNSIGNPAAWRFDLALKRWAPFPQSGVEKGHGHLDYVDHHLYMVTPAGFRVFDFASGEWTTPTPFESGIGGLTAHVYIPSTDEFLFFGNGIAKTVPRSQFGVRGALVNVPDPPPMVTQTYLGATYYPPEDLALFWDGGPTIVTYDPHARTFGTVAPEGDPGPEAGAGTFGRFSYCGGRVALLNGVHTDMWFLGPRDVQPPPPPPPPPLESLDPYYGEPVGLADVLMRRDCGSLPDDWPTMDVTTDEDVTAAKSYVLTNPVARIRVHYRTDPYPALTVKGARCVAVVGVTEIGSGRRPLLPVVNATHAYKYGVTPIRPGGLFVQDLQLSPGLVEQLRPGLAPATSEGVGVPGDQTFLVIRRTEISRTGHHSFITPSSRQMYVEVADSEFFEADSHLAYIDQVALAWVHDSKFHSPGWGHALRCVARHCIITDNQISNVELDGSVLPVGGDNLYEPTRTYIGMHPLDLYACGQNEVHGNTVTLYADKQRNGLFVVQLARGRQDIRNCDTGEVRDGQWTALIPNTAEFLNPARWTTAMPFVTEFAGNTLRCVGPDAAKCSGVEVDSTFPILNVEEQPTFQAWLRANLFPTMDALRAAVPADHPEYGWIASRVVAGKEAAFLKGNIPSNVPLEVPATWYERDQVTLQGTTLEPATLPLLRMPSLEGQMFCYGNLAPNPCTDQFDGQHFRRAYVTVQ